MGVVIRRWVWLESIGVVSGCFPHITYISLLHLYLFFLQQHPYFFFHFVKMIFRSCFSTVKYSVTQYCKVQCYTVL